MFSECPENHWAAFYKQIKMQKQFIFCIPISIFSAAVKMTLKILQIRESQISLTIFAPIWSCYISSKNQICEQRCVGCWLKMSPCVSSRALKFIPSGTDVNMWAQVLTFVPSDQSTKSLLHYLRSAEFVLIQIILATWNIGIWKRRRRLKFWFLNSRW